MMTAEVHTDESVTVVVVTHNSARHLTQLRESFSASTLMPDRLLVVDNASSDDTVGEARRAGFDVVKRNTNDGFGAGCNLGLQKTSTEYVLFCNPDVRPSDCAIQKLADGLKKVPRAAVAGAAVGSSPGERRFSCVTGNVWSLLPGWLQRIVPQRGGSFPVRQGQGQIKVDFVEGAFLMCRAAALRQVGGFDETFFLYAEEEDLCRRLRKSGWETVLIPSAIVGHARGTSSRDADTSIMASFYYRSLYQYYRRYHSRLYAEWARCVLALFLMCDCIYRRITRRPQIYSIKTVTAAFRSVACIRHDYESRRGSAVSPPKL